MLSSFLNFFRPPVIDDPDKNDRARNLHTVLLALIILVALWAWYPIFVQGGISRTIAIVLLVFLVGLFVLEKFWYTDGLGTILVTGLWLAVVGATAALGGIKNTGFISIAILIIVSGLILKPRTSLFFSILTIIAAGVLAFLDLQGLLPRYSSEPTSTVLMSYGLTILGIGVVYYIQVTALNRNIQNSRTTEKTIGETLSTLEQKFQALEQDNIDLEHKNLTLFAIADMAGVAARAKSEPELLNQAVQLLADKFHAEHTAIFLVDESGENLILTATNSLEGKRLLANKYSLRITQSAPIHTSPDVGIIKHQSSSGNQFIISPATLPESKSNLSLPIISGEKLTGLLNIQSNTPETWQNEKEMMEIIANQIAVSLDNIRLLEQLQSRLQEIVHLAGKTTQTAWKRWSSGEQVGYQYDQLHVAAVTEQLPQDVYEAVMNKRTVPFVTAGDHPGARLIAPVVLRNNVIGLIGYEELNPAHEWSSSEITLLETVAARVSLALENSRLVAEAEQRAERESVIGHISSRIRETMDIETILNTAIKEIHQSFNLDEAEIRLQPSSAEDTRSQSSSL
jgi:GAF domain-containing protein